MRINIQIISPGGFISFFLSSNHNTFLSKQDRTKIILKVLGNDKMQSREHILFYRWIGPFRHRATLNISENKVIWKNQWIEINVCLRKSSYRILFARRTFSYKALKIKLRKYFDQDQTLLSIRKRSAVYISSKRIETKVIDWYIVVKI